jgi:hypothetical protein
LLSKRDNAEDQDGEKALASPQHIHDFSAGSIHCRIGNQECGLQFGKPGVRNRYVVLNSSDGGRQRLPVEVADCNCKCNQNSYVPSV